MRRAMSSPVQGAMLAARGAMPRKRRLARRMFELVEPMGVIPYSADEPNEAMFALGFTDGS